MNSSWTILTVSQVVDGRYLVRAILEEPNARTGPILMYLDAEAWQEIERECLSQVQQNPGTQEIHFRVSILTSLLKREQERGWNPKDNEVLSLSRADVDDVLHKTNILDGVR